jgi:hypothetical protein
MLLNDGGVEQGDEADEAGASDGASQLIPGVRRLTEVRGSTAAAAWLEAIGGMGWHG